MRRKRDAIIAIATMAALFTAGSVSARDTRPMQGPPQICEACPTPRPTPIVVGVTPAPATPAPLPTAPDTSTR